VSTLPAVPKAGNLNHPGARPRGRGRRLGAGSAPVGRASLSAGGGLGASLPPGFGCGPRVEPLLLGAKSVAHISSTPGAPPCRRPRHARHPPNFPVGGPISPTLPHSRPPPGLDRRSLADLVGLAGARPEFPPGAPPAYASLARACWAADPAARPGLGAVAARLEAMAAGGAAH
jgi:hypothetical protein